MRALIPILSAVVFFASQGTDALAQRDSIRCAVLPEAGMRLVDTVFGTLMADDGKPLSSPWSGMVLAAIAQEFPAPRNLNISIRSNEHMTPLGRLVTLSVEGQVVFYAHRDGTIDQVLLTESTLSPALDSTLMAAVQRVDSNRTLPPFPPALTPDLVRLRLTLGDRDRRSPGQPFFVTRQATWKLDHPAAGSRYNRAPEYPVNARLAGVTDSLVLSFVIDETGAAAMSTARFLAGSYRDFKLAVLEVIPGYKFHPAMIAGCPVPQRVTMPFVFSLER
jgi:hypothetical protein